MRARSMERIPARCWGKEEEAKRPGCFPAHPFPIYSCSLCFQGHSNVKSCDKSCDLDMSRAHQVPAVEYLSGYGVCINIGTPQNKGQGLPEHCIAAAMHQKGVGMGKGNRA